MARLRKFASYRSVERPYTRKSKYKKKGFIRANTNLKIVHFDMGATNKNFDYILELKSKSALQIRHEAFEAARQTCNRYLEKYAGKGNYHFKILPYPHHILRENPLASGAGADRMSTGMKMSFGKVIGIAAQIKEGQTLVKLRVNEPNIKAARAALARFYQKIPCTCRIEMVKAQ